MFLKHRNIISKIKRSKVTDYAALIVISGRVLAISSAQEGISGSIFYLFGKFVCLSCSNVRAFHENSDRYSYQPLEHQYPTDRLLLSFEVTSTNSVDPDQTNLGNRLIWVHTCVN